MSPPIQLPTLLVVAVADWIQREQLAAIVYLLEENRVLQARLHGRKLRFSDDDWAACSTTTIAKPHKNSVRVVQRMTWKRWLGWRIASREPGADR